MPCFPMATSTSDSDRDGDHAKVQEISTQLWEQRIGQGGQLVEQIVGIT